MPRKARENRGEIKCPGCGRQAYVRREGGQARLWYVHCPSAGEFAGCGRITMPGAGGQAIIMENARLFGPGGAVPAANEPEPAPAPVLDPAMNEPEPALEPSPDEGRRRGGFMQFLGGLLDE